MVLSSEFSWFMLGLLAWLETSVGPLYAWSSLEFIIICSFYYACLGVLGMPVVIYLFWKEYLVLPSRWIKVWRPAALGHSSHISVKYIPYLAPVCTHGLFRFWNTMVCPWHAMLWGVLYYGMVGFSNLGWTSVLKILMKSYNFAPAFWCELSFHGDQSLKKLMIQISIKKSVSRLTSAIHVYKDKMAFEINNPVKMI